METIVSKECMYRGPTKKYKKHKRKSKKKTLAITNDVRSLCMKNPVFAFHWAINFFLRYRIHFVALNTQFTIDVQLSLCCIERISDGQFFVYIYVLNIFVIEMLWSVSNRQNNKNKKQNEKNSQFNSICIDYTENSPTQKMRTRTP